MRQVLRDAGGFTDNVRTIDSWQGREKEFMIFSATRCNQQGKIGFIKNDRRMNVALTRAMHGLIIVGNARTLSSDSKYEILINVFRETGTLVSGIENAIKLIEDRSRPQLEDYI